ncbi:hypothetical protein V6S67_01940 [Arthrobacter sp. Soc17.1.1.1]|uniref:hypothetical protein n=1 Tax=Arthrobacter sp. Soc17.1.1.1 TaxID=3121277 RepID=UPI002FE4BA5A
MTWKLGEEEKFQRAQVLAAKVNLLLDAIVDRSGRPYDYPVIGAGTRKIGHYVSRTRWSRLRNGQDQVVPDECLRAIATVFGVNPEYLLDENAPLPPEVEAELPRVRIKRLSEVRDFAVKALAVVDPERLKAITEILDEAIHSSRPAPDTKTDRR